MHISLVIQNALKKDSKFKGIADFSTPIHLEHPADISNGDYSTNIAMTMFQNAKDDLPNDIKSPRDLAQRFVDQLNENAGLSKYIEKIEIAGSGFINFYVKDDYFINLLDEIIDDSENYGKFKTPSRYPKKISLEHTQVNPNKEPHVGHLRNACIGDAIVQLLSFTGHDVKTQYYQNDVGVQVASIVLAKKKQFIKEDDFGSFIAWASAAYVDIENRTDCDVEKEEIQKNIALQDNDDAILAHEITDKILHETLKGMQPFGIEYDLIVREGDILRNKLWDKTFELLKKSDAFYLADSGERKGCWLIKLPDAEDKVIVRSNGVPTYAGNDIAYHLWKFGVLDDFKYLKVDWDTQSKDLYSTSSDTGAESRDDFSSAEAVVDVIDVHQTYPQEAVKAAIRAIGYTDFASQYYHVNYGFVYLSTKTADLLGVSYQKGLTKIGMSGRKGTVVTINYFVDLMKERLTAEHGDFETLSEVVYGALKFEMLKYDTYQDIIFDIDNALDQKGYSASYIQYTYARTQSMLNKVNDNNLASTSDISAGNTQDISGHESRVLKKLNELPEVIQRVVDDLSPHYMCIYLFELAQAFNAFYNAEQVIGSDREAFRLKLTKTSALALKRGLSLLGISAPVRM